MTISFKTQIITVIRPGTLLERGNQVDDWSSATEHQVTGCRLQPQAGQEGAGGRREDAVQRRWKLFAPQGADVTERDRVRHQGQVYEVAAYVQHWPSPTGTLAHVEATLQWWEG